MPQALARFAATGLVCAFALAAAACGNDDESDTPAAAKPAATAVRNPATESPVALGIVEVKGEPETRAGVEAAAEYLNKEAGGLLGHRIETHSCLTDPTPQQSIACANELVAKDPVAVIMGGDFVSDAAFPIYERAGVPVLGERVIANQQLVNPVSLGLGPGIPGVLSALAGYVKDELDGTSAVTVARPTPRAVKQLVDAPFQAAGVSNSWATFSEENPDFTATFAAAVGKKPDILVVNIDDNAQCVPAMNALKALATDIPVFHIICSDDSVFEEAGSLADGQLFYAPLDSIAGVDSPDVRIFNRIVEQYASPEVDGYNGAVGVSPTLTLARVLEKQGGTEVTPKSILKAFADADGVRIFMGPELECGAVERLPRLCTASMRIFTTENGEKKVLTDYIASPQYLG
jgi:branched-chain amino acid transport system substrate-binding protein